MNPLIGMLAKQTVGNMPQMKMIQQFNELRQQMQGKDPKAIIDDMLKSGKINGQQLEQAKQMAMQMQQMFK